ncbi:MAG: hypothetical protein PQJ50_03155, partial [Spirochaetales bacterium]|nr:hypothetical protein [Spirochaetales bacterium]
NSRESETVESAAVSESESTPAASVPVSTGGAAEGGISDGTQGGDHPELSWEGGNAFVSYIPEPDFNIPYGTNPPEVITVSFSVYSDGTVYSVRVLPPTGYPALDSEIRRYVTSFLFESFDPSEEDKRGLLRLNLKAGGGGVW